MRVEMPRDCMKGNESFSLMAGAWGFSSLAQESVKMSITAIHRETVMWARRASLCPLGRCGMVVRRVIGFSIS